MKTPRPLYSIGTWDGEAQAYTSPFGLGTCLNITRSELRDRIRVLRSMGYQVDRMGKSRDGHPHDRQVLIERTDGTILRDWEL